MWPNEKRYVFHTSLLCTATNYSLHERLNFERQGNLCQNGSQHQALFSSSTMSVPASPLVEEVELLQANPQYMLMFDMLMAGSRLCQYAIWLLEETHFSKKIYYPNQTCTKAMI